MFPPPPSLQLFCNASLIGWGAKLGDVLTGGCWDASEEGNINVLELKAVHRGLLALCSDIRDTHIRLRIDNATAVACI